MVQSRFPTLQAFVPWPSLSDDGIAASQGSPQIYQRTTPSLSKGNCEDESLALYRISCYLWWHARERDSHSVWGLATWGQWLGWPILGAVWRLPSLHLWHQIFALFSELCRYHCVLHTSQPGHFHALEIIFAIFFFFFFPDNIFAGILVI